MKRFVVAAALVAAVSACVKTPKLTPSEQQQLLQRQTQARAHFDQAIKLLRLSPPDYFHALENLRQAITLDENLFPAQYNLGFLLALANDPQGAEAAWHKALKLRPGDRATLFNLADLYRRTGRAHLAEKLLKEFCRSHPEDIEAQNNLVVVLRTQGKYDESLALAQQVLERDAKNPLAYNNLATVFSEKGEQAMAEEIFRQGLELQPQNPTLLNNQAQVLLRQQKIQQALDSFERAFQRDPTLVESGMNAAEVYAQCGDWQRAEATYRQVALRNPGALDALVGQAVALRALGRTEEAEKIYQQVLGLDRNHPLALFNLGLLYMQVRQKPGWACEAFQRYLASSRTRPEDEKMARSLLENLRLTNPQECATGGGK